MDKDFVLMRPRVPAWVRKTILVLLCIGIIAAAVTARQALSVQPDNDDRQLRSQVDEVREARKKVRPLLDTCDSSEECVRLREAYEKGDTTVMVEVGEKVRLSQEREAREQIRTDVARLNGEAQKVINNSHGVNTDRLVSLVDVMNRNATGGSLADARHSINDVSGELDKVRAAVDEAIQQQQQQQLQQQLQQQQQQLQQQQQQLRSSSPNTHTNSSVNSAKNASVTKTVTCTAPSTITVTGTGTLTVNGKTISNGGTVNGTNFTATSIGTSPSIYVSWTSKTGSCTIR